MKIGYELKGEVALLLDGPFLPLAPASIGKAAAIRLEVAKDIVPSSTGVCPAEERFGGL